MSCAIFSPILSTVDRRSLGGASGLFIEIGFGSTILRSCFRRDISTASSLDSLILELATEWAVISDCLVVSERILMLRSNFFIGFSLAGWTGVASLVVDLWHVSLNSCLKLCSKSIMSDTSSRIRASMASNSSYFRLRSVSSLACLVSSRLFCAWLSHESTPPTLTLTPILLKLRYFVIAFLHCFKSSVPERRTLCLRCRQGCSWNWMFRSPPRCLLTECRTRCRSAPVCIAS